jgi:mono/diheme cytochrome c family protein
MSHGTIAAVVTAIVILLAGCAQNTESRIPYSEIPPEGDPARGEQLFNESINAAPPCSICHAAGNTASPDLTGYGAIAGERVEGETAHEYTFYGIAEPGRYIVEGYGNAMYDRYDEKLTPQQIADLIAYLLTL